MKHEGKQEGFLRVTGEKCIHIPLTGSPEEVLVEFLDEEIVPCNHHHHHHHHHKHHQDTLVWRLVYKVRRCNWFFIQKEFYLEIAWDVESVRTIKWVARY